MKKLLSTVLTALIVCVLSASPSQAVLSFTTTEAGFFPGTTVDFVHPGVSNQNAPYTDPVSGMTVDGTNIEIDSDIAIDANLFMATNAIVLLPEAASHFAFIGINALTTEFTVEAFSDLAGATSLGSMAFTQTIRPGEISFVGVSSSDGDILRIEFTSTGAPLGGGSPSYFIDDLSYQAAPVASGVPEPSVAVLSLMALSGVGLVATRRRVA